MILWWILIGCQCFIGGGESSESANDIVVDSDWLSVFHQRGESSESANDIVVDSDWLSVFHQRGESSESANDIVVDSDWLSVFHQRGKVLKVPMILWWILIGCQCFIGGGKF